MLIVYRLITGVSGRHYQADIARKLECSPQTVARIIDKIELHIGKEAHIERELDGKKRYYQLVPNSSKRNLGFSFEELHLLCTARDMAASTLPASVLNRVDETLTHLALTLGERATFSGHIQFQSKGYIDYAPHLEAVATLRTAIDKKQVCIVTYTGNGRKEPSRYRYAPGRVVVMGGTMYVQGYCIDDGTLLKSRPTTFSVHRISDVVMTGEYFKFNASDTKASVFGLDWHEPKRMRVHIAKDAADYVRDRIWSADQTIDEHEDGSLTLAVTTTSQKELKAWVLGFDGYAQLIDFQK
ncbi:helix-turn-helix transcriptional regulator [Thalassospira povalilytica]|uniref:helix-turn-helix transcriptional regulator n=1 Tax=Thalassospira povalilytica TaxID=732237 RepID=UPI003AA9CC2D